MVKKVKRETVGDEVTFVQTALTNTIETTKKQFDDFAASQSDLLSKISKTNREWLERMQVEISLATTFSAKLVEARSIPEAVITYQEWTCRQMEMAAQDTKHLLDDAQKFVEASKHFFGDNWQSKNSAKRLY
jgi:Phasin protein